VSESSTVTLVGRFQDDITPGLQRAQSEIANTRVSIDKMGPAERAWSEEIQRVRTSIIEQRDALVLRKEALDDPATRRAIKEAAQLHDEINKLTKAEEVSTLTTKQRKEGIVALREVMRGNFTQLSGTMMVLEEGDGGVGAALKGFTAMLGGPYVVAAGLASIATVGVAAALWKASEAEAEMVHKTNLLGQTLGVSGEAIRGFQYLAVGTGVTTEELGRVFGIFEKNLGKNSEKFRELGITARDPLAAFEQVMDRAKGMGDAVERNTFLNEALGRGWERIAPVIMQGGDAAKEAIEKMRIPEDTLANFERANKAQIEIDKSFLSIKLHAGEAFSGIRAGFKELEADGAKLAENHGLMAALGALTFRGRALANAERARNPTEGLGPAAAPVMSDEQIAALKEADKTLAKGSLDIAIQGVKDEWKSRIDLFKAGTPEYLKEVKAEAEAEAEVREKWTKKGARGGISDGKSDLYAHSTVKNSVELNDPEEFRVKPDQGHEDQLKIQTDRTRARAKEISELNKAQAEKARLEQTEVNQYYKWEELKTKKAEEENRKRKEAQQKLFDATEAGLEKQILLAEQGKFSLKGLGDTMKTMAQEGIARLISQTVVSLAQSAITGAAWAGPAMAASIATFGSADAAGSAAYEAAMMTAQFSGGHAQGGTQFGGWAPRHESGPEMAHAVVPTQIYQASHTSTTNNNGETHFHFHGMSERDALRVIDRARTNNTRSSH
jgi:hypothetical protein